MKVFARFSSTACAFGLVAAHSIAQAPEAPPQPEVRTALRPATVEEFRKAGRSLSRAWEDLAERSGTKPPPPGVALEAPAPPPTALSKAWEKLTGQAPRPLLGVRRKPQPPAGASHKAPPATDVPAGSGEMVNPLEFRSVNGQLNATLTVVKAHNYIGADPVYLRSYNGQLVGPTLRAKPGDTLRITVRNDLEPEILFSGTMDTLNGFNVTNLHTHGLHVSPGGTSDNVLLEIGPQASQDYVITIRPDHPCGTFWYHAHRHGSTAAQVASGMEGALIIEGGIDELPEIKAARERVFVIQQIPYIYKNKLIDPETKQPVQFGYPEGIIEQQDAGFIFPPSSWDKLGRFITVNGQQIPTIRVRPGAMERWRLIDAALREPVELTLVRAAGGSARSPDQLPLHQIAIDGIPLGKVVDAKDDELEMWPGYRADVLFQAPPEAGATYYLRDNRELGKGVTIPEAQRYLARVIVEGDPVVPAPALPADRAMTDFRPPTLKNIPDNKVGHQTASYGIFLDAEKDAKFMIDGRPFSHDNPARSLTLGTVDEWDVTSVNGVGAVSHPFHIHVNPFEVISMIEPGKDGKPDIEHIKEPVWHDTIILNEGWRVKFRTEYKDFVGLFVQHCHILDHEDQGMMQAVEIRDPKQPPLALDNAPTPVAEPYPAPAWSLPRGDGGSDRLASFRGKPTVLFLGEGFGCLRCSQQIDVLQAYATSFAERGINLVGIGAETPEALRAAWKESPCSFPLFADALGATHRAYGCFEGKPVHGVFLLDAEGAVRWKAIGKTPYADIDGLLRLASGLRAPTTSSSPAPLATK